MPDAQNRLESGEVLDLLASLVQKSLVVYEEDEQGQGRYRLLETVRQYARDRLLETGEAVAVRERHRDWCLALVEQGVEGEGETARMDRLEEEHDNLRAALEWSGAQGEGEVALRLGGALWWFWSVRGYHGEGREHLAGLLALPGAEARSAARAWALQGAGNLAWHQGDYGAARTLHEESLAIYREVGDKWGIAWALVRLGHVARDQGEYGTARTLYEESLAIFRELADKQGIGWSLHNLGRVAQARGDDGAARALYEESLAILREAGDKRCIAWSLWGLGVVTRDRWDCGAAGALLEESLAIFRELADKVGIVHELEGLAALAVTQARSERAVRLFGAAEGLREAMGASLPPAERAEHDRSVAAVRTAMGDAAFAAAWAEGRAMALPQAVEYALKPEGMAAGE